MPVLKITNAFEILEQRNYGSVFKRNLSVQDDF